MAIQKFKVGDMVVGNHPHRYTVTNLGWKGVVRKVCSDGYMDVKGEGNPKWNSLFVSLDPKYFDLLPCDEKIVIIHDGKTTTATMYCNDGSKKTATARCAPEDTFDFKFGANLAMERLIGKTETKVEPKPEPPKYYNGKVVCISSKDKGFTAGKIYEIVDGKFRDNKDRIRPITTHSVRKVEDLTTGYWSTWRYKFIPLVEDENKPLTTDELRKMDGKKVWCSSLVDGKENFDDNHCGWP